MNRKVGFRADYILTSGNLKVGNVERRLLVEVSAEVFEFESAYIANISTAKMVCITLKVSFIIIYHLGFIIFKFSFADGGKEFEDASAY